MKKSVGIVGASGYVGQRFVALLENHPYFDLKRIAASERSVGRRFGEVIEGREIPGLSFSAQSLNMSFSDLRDLDAFCDGLDLVFCAVNMQKSEIIELEEALARHELVVVSNNSALRSTDDVPMLIPELNFDHVQVIERQRKRLGTKHGFIVCKPNCSIQSYVPALTAVRDLGIEAVFVATYQAISGAGKDFDRWPEMRENLIPYISGEEAKSELEPLKIWGGLRDGKIINADSPKISAHCYRVAVQEGHTAAVSVKFKTKVSTAEIISAFERFNESIDTSLPHAPSKLLIYHEEENRPQPVLDGASEHGMAIHISRLREDPIFDIKFCCMSHNTLRGAAGGAVLTAEYLYRDHYLDR
ncbi:MAG: aspartate-semialdehyde dehydrogenase [Eubacteriales bacterium]|nr:aspartate-semialdehyde dehydrogenase [Eubacteriales bacterium]